MHTHMYVHKQVERRRLNNSQAHQLRVAVAEEKQSEEQHECVPVIYSCLLVQCKVANALL
jgi:hypothetical protein